MEEGSKGIVKGDIIMYDIEVEPFQGLRGRVPLGDGIIGMNVVWQLRKRGWDIVYRLKGEDEIEKLLIDIAEEFGIPYRGRGKRKKSLKDLGNSYFDKSINVGRFSGYWWGSGKYDREIGYNIVQLFSAYVTDEKMVLDDLEPFPIEYDKKNKMVVVNWKSTNKHLSWYKSEMDKVVNRLLEYGYRVQILGKNLWYENGVEMLRDIASKELITVVTGIGHIKAVTGARYIWLQVADHSTFWGGFGNAVQIKYKYPCLGCFMQYCEKPDLCESQWCKKRLKWKYVWNVFKQMQEKNWNKKVVYIEDLEKEAV